MLVRLAVGLLQGRVAHWAAPSPSRCTARTAGRCNLTYTAYSRLAEAVEADAQVAKEKQSCSRLHVSAEECAVAQEKEAV